MLRVRNGSSLFFRLILRKSQTQKLAEQLSAALLLVTSPRPQTQDVLWTGGSLLVLAAFGLSILMAALAGLRREEWGLWPRLSPGEGGRTDQDLARPSELRACGCHSCTLILGESLSLPGPLFK